MNLARGPTLGPFLHKTANIGFLISLTLLLCRPWSRLRLSVWMRLGGANTNDSPSGLPYGLTTLFLPLQKSITLYTQTESEYRCLAKHREHYPMFVSIRSPQALRFSPLTPPPFQTVLILYQTPFP